MANELKSCPFCGGKFAVTSVFDNKFHIKTNGSCLGCAMEYQYIQSFAVSNVARVAENDSFEDVWNGRCTDGT